MQKRWSSEWRVCIIIKNQTMLAMSNYGFVQYKPKKYK